MASIQPDVPGLYVISLVVSDGWDESVPAEVTVAAISVEDGVVVTLVEVSDEIEDLPLDVFQNNNSANALGTPFCRNQLSAGPKTKAKIRPSPGMPASLSE